MIRIWTEGRTNLGVAALWRGPLAFLPDIDRQLFAQRWGISPAYVQALPNHHTLFDAGRCVKAYCTQGG